MLIENLIYFIISAAALVISATFLVTSLSKIASFLRISEFSAAFIIMAVATSIPELFVGVSSALSGNPALSLGNVIGASILDLTLVIGIIVLVGKGIKIKNGKIGTDIYYVLGSIILLIGLFVIGNSLSRTDGIILVLFFLFNSYRMFKKRKKYRAEFGENRIKKIAVISSVAIFLISIVVLFIASDFAVKYASLIAEELKFPEIVVGLFLLSVATILPELIFGIRAVRMGHEEMAIGDQTGTVIANIALITGVVAIIQPIKAAFTPFIISAIFLLIAAFIFVVFLKSKREISIKEGIWLIFLYVLFVVMEIFLKI